MNDNPSCLVGHGSVMQQLRGPHEDNTFHVLHMDLSRLHPIAENHGGREVSNASVAVLKLQDITHRRSLLLLWVKSKGDGEVMEATDIIVRDDYLHRH